MKKKTCNLSAKCQLQIKYEYLENKNVFKKW